MFRKSNNNREIFCPVIYAEQHTTSPGQVEEAITRNDRNERQPKPDLYDAAGLIDICDAEMSGID